MKTTNKGFYIPLVILLFISLNFCAKKTEIQITTSSKEALKLFIEGREKFENAEAPKAALLFDQAILKDTNFAMAYHYKSLSGGGYNVWLKNHNKALSLIDKISEGERLQILYVETGNKGDGLKQKEYLDQLLAKFPSDVRVQMMAGDYYYGIQNYSTAIDHYKKSIDFEKEYAPAFNMIGICQSTLNNYQEAEKAFQSYIKLLPDHSNSYDSYAWLLLKMGKYEESIIQYKKALEIDPAFSFSLEGMGNNYIFKGDYQTARKYYQDFYDKATSIDSKFWALSLKAISYVHEGKIDTALKVFDEYISLAEKENLPNEVINALANQAWILCETGKPADGLKLYEKAISLIKDSKLSDADKDNYNTYSSAWLFYALAANNEMDKAQAECEKCKQKFESRKNPGEELWLNGALGIFEFKKGNYDEAIELFSKGSKEDPGNWYYTALAYDKKGDKYKAVEFFDKVANYKVNSLGLALFRKPAIEAMKK